MASFTGQEANLSAEGLDLLGLCFYKLLKPPHLLLVHTPAEFLQLSALDTQKQIYIYIYVMLMMDEMTVSLYGDMLELCVLCWEHTKELRKVASCHAISMLTCGRQQRRRRCAAAGSLHRDCVATRRRPLFTVLWVFSTLQFVVEIFYPLVAIQNQCLHSFYTTAEMPEGCDLLLI